MSFQYNEILNIPDRCLLNKKITKVFFQRNFSLSAAEKKLLANDIVSMDWLARITPSNSNIPVYSDSDYEFLELHVMTCTLKSGTVDQFADKCIELFQKNIPQQIILIIEDENQFILNTADKRINQADKSKRTIETLFKTEPISKLYKTELSTAFFEEVCFDNLDKSNLKMAYTSYSDAVVHLLAASHTGKYRKRNRKLTSEDSDVLGQIDELQKEIVSLTSQIKKADQLNDKVNLNVNIQTRRTEIEALKTKLTTQDGQD